MPFRSLSQMRAAFAGGLGPEMQARAKTWAHETPNIKGLPTHVSMPKPRFSLKPAKGLRLRGIRLPRP